MTDSPAGSHRKGSAQRWITAVVVAVAVGVGGIAGTGSDDDPSDGDHAAAVERAPTTSPTDQVPATTTATTGAPSETTTSGMPPPASSTTTPPEAVAQSGTGNAVVDVVKPQPGVPALLVATHDGGGPFQVRSRDAAGNPLATVVDTTGPSGTYLFDTTAGQETTAFEVTADGSWTLDVRPVPSIDIVPIDPGRSGTGDYVFALVGLQAARPLAVTHVGTGSFHVSIYTDHLADLINVVGPYDDTVTIPGADTSVLVIVQAAGDWSFAAG